MDRNKLPLIAPQYEPRYISAKDVLDLLGHGRVPGVNYDDARIQEIRACVLGVQGKTELQAALRTGYLHDRSSTDFRTALQTAWSWWCTAAGHPHIVLSPDSLGLCQVRCDLISTGRQWLVSDVPHYEQLPGEVTTVYRTDCRFKIDERVLLVGGIEMDDAITVARNLVEYTTTGSFKQRRSDAPPHPDHFGALKQPLVPMERSDGG